jgi:hypothetical protein
MQHFTTSMGRLSKLKLYIVELEGYLLSMYCYNVWFPYNLKPLGEIWYV